MKHIEEKIKVINKTIEALRKEKELGVSHSWDVSTCPLCRFLNRGKKRGLCVGCPMTLIKLSFGAELGYRTGSTYCSCIINACRIEIRDPAGVDFLIGLMEALKRKLYSKMMK